MVRTTFGAGGHSDSRDESPHAARAVPTRRQAVPRLVVPCTGEFRGTVSAPPEDLRSSAGDQTAWTRRDTLQRIHDQIPVGRGWSTPRTGWSTSTSTSASHPAHKVRQAGSSAPNLSHRPGWVVIHRSAVDITRIGMRQESSSQAEKQRMWAICKAILYPAWRSGSPSCRAVEPYGVSVEDAWRIGPALLG